MKRNVHIMITPTGAFIVYDADTTERLTKDNPFKTVKALLEWLQRMDYKVTNTIWP